MTALADRVPQVSSERLLRELVPPPQFAAARFETYAPAADQPTQAAALQRLRGFADGMAAPAGCTPVPRLGLRRAAPRGPAGVYLDGGFGVGKTHLLASLWHAVPGPKSFATFPELTNLVGALGFQPAVDALAGSRLLCIDEFELDDPGDTVLMSSLLARLVEGGTRLAATSNTLPGALGAGRFAAEDFRREIHGLAVHFGVVSIFGEDYRHRGLPPAPQPYDDATLTRSAASTPGASLDDFPRLLERLAAVHPSRYGALLDGVRAVHLRGVETVSDPAVGLRLVVLADRMYDRDLPVLASGVPLDRVFAPDLHAGGYRKKYARAVSRLVALARRGAGRGG